jgi:threonine synthase
MYVKIAVISVATFVCYLSIRQVNKSRKKRRKSIVVNGIEGLVLNTPMVRIKSLSKLTGCDIYGKAEFLSVTGSPKGRLALAMIEKAERQGFISPNCGCTLFEGTVGSTGIALAVLARAKGYNCHIVMPGMQIALSCGSPHLDRRPGKGKVRNITRLRSDCGESKALLDCR